MNPLQSKIEQTAKEYLTYKDASDKAAEQAKKEKETIIDKVIGMKEEEIYSTYFDTFASLEFLIKDMLQLKTKLYNQIELVKDIIDIPKDILDLVMDYNQPLIFAIIGDEKKVVDESVYNKHKENYVAGAMQIAKMNTK